LFRRKRKYKERKEKEDGRERKGRTMKLEKIET
jgi:hypothetical protein